MKCSFCGKAFELDQCRPGCSGCPLQSGCGGIRCPYCGYNNVREAGLIRWLRALFNKEPDLAGSAEERQ
jgi:hypothetical protein